MTREEYDAALMRRLIDASLKVGGMEWSMTWEYPGWLSCSLDLDPSVSVSCTPEPIDAYDEDQDDDAPYWLAWQPYLDCGYGHEVPREYVEKWTGPDDYRVPCTRTLETDAAAILAAIQRLLIATYGWFFRAIQIGDQRVASDLREVAGSATGYEDEALLHDLTVAQVRFWAQYVSHPEGGRDA